jgi:hypothetical protein
LQGYNGSIFAYGQTGSGKTFTIQGLGIGGNEQSLERNSMSMDEDMPMDNMIGRNNLNEKA